MRVDLHSACGLFVLFAALTLPACSGKSASSGAGNDAAGNDATIGASDAGTTADTTNGDASPSDATPAETSTTSDAGYEGGCGWKGEGTPLHVASDLDLCLPPVVCNSETCPPTLGKCVYGACVFQGDYKGLATLPEAWSTYYCSLPTGGCHGVTQIEFPEVTAGKIADKAGFPLCGAATSGTTECVGIAAAPPMIVGNSQLAVDPTTGKGVSSWGLGLTEATGLCYELTGPGGKILVALTDRCGGYCKCGGSGYEECGPCVNAPDMAPNCSCVGTVPGLFTQCCGDGCATTQQDCDWCASNNHPHFDLDVDAFNWMCGPDKAMGSCQLTSVRYVSCLDPNPAWPPGGGAASCGASSFACSAGSPSPHQTEVGTSACCCNWDLCPQTDGSCAAAPTSCPAGSCACSAGADTGTSEVTAGCCCLPGLTPSAGACQS